MHSIPTLIIGGGVAGAAVAASLAERRRGAGVTVADVDLFGRYSTTALAAGDCWTLMDQPLAARLALQSARYYLEHAAKLDYRPRGAMWLVDAHRFDRPTGYRASARAAGAHAVDLPVDLLRSRFPMFGDTSDLAGAVFAPGDGRLLPHRLRLHFLNVAEAGGVQLMDRWQVVGIAGDRAPFEVTLRQVTGRGVRPALEDEIAATAKKPAAAPPLVVKVDQLINAAGPWAGRVAALAGVPLQIRPRPRHVFVLRKDSVNYEPLPGFVDKVGGWSVRYVERDRKPAVLLSTPAEGDARVDFAAPTEQAYRDRWEPVVTRRLPGLAGAAVAAAWTAHDDATPDGLPVIGESRERPGLYHCCGLSGRGIALARGSAEAVAIRIVHGRWPVGLDLDEMAAGRFAGGTGARP
ncbi:MAG TPA: FAD-binding oxidoreductase [Humisphaera sp.]